MKPWRVWLGGVKETVSSILSTKREECLLCRHFSVIHADHLNLCHSCYTRIPWIREVLCPICGRGDPCYDCQRRKHAHFKQSRSAVRYDETMKELLARYKYRGDEKLKSLIGHMLVHALRLLQLDNASMHVTSALIQEVITFVPVSERRMEERGFNQAEQMAIELGRRVGIPVVPLLNRSKHTDKQSFKKRSERLDDLAHVFELGVGYLDRLKSHSADTYVIYLVDDVYTTGSTMNQCAKVLVESLPASVFGVTWAR